MCSFVRFLRLPQIHLKEPDSRFASPSGKFSPALPKTKRSPSCGRRLRALRPISWSCAPNPAEARTKQNLPSEGAGCLEVVANDETLNNQAERPPEQANKVRVGPHHQKLE